MPGGTQERYDAIEGLVRKMDARWKMAPAFTYIGPGARWGTSVKTVHTHRIRHRADPLRGL